jgi:hypothetical protein
MVLENDTEGWLELALYTSSKESRFRATNAYAHQRYVTAYEIAPDEQHMPYIVHVADRIGAGVSADLGFVRIVDYDDARNLHVELRPLFKTRVPS